MNDSTETAIRLGLALYQRSTLEGDGFYSLYDLVFDDEAEKSKSKNLFRRIFRGDDRNFWIAQEELARLLESKGLAQVERRQILGHGGGDYWLKLTPFGRAIYSLGYLQSDSKYSEIDGLGIEDLAQALLSDDDAIQTAQDLRRLDSKLDDLNLTNFKRASVNAYVTILISICDMPDRDIKLFWTVLERLSNFAGVASLIVAIIALRLAK